MKKSIITINNVNKGISNNNFNDNFDFINQDIDNQFVTNNKTSEDYVKVKYLKGKR